ncbi:MAG: 5-formyltetrahydrofolate cyclo-ligase [Balneolaceae bacterium]
MDKRSEKKKIRNRYLRYRSSLPQKDVDRKSNAVLNQLKSFDILGDASFIHCYLSIAERGEINTFTLIEWLIEQRKKVAVPKSDFETKEMKNFLLTDLNSLVENSLGIPEPAGGVEIPNEKIDVVLVPMVAADPDKNRLGYGEGFYDRFLTKTPAVKVGLVYEECLMDDSLPVEEFDVPMDYLVTEKRIL